MICIQLRSTHGVDVRQNRSVLLQLAMRARPALPSQPAPGVMNHASVVAPCSALATDQGRRKGSGGLLVWSAYKVNQMPVFFGAIPTNHWLATEA